MLMSTSLNKLIHSSTYKCTLALGLSVLYKTSSPRSIISRLTHSRLLDFSPSKLQPSLGRAIAQLGSPLMLKSRILAYDVRGNFFVHSAHQTKALVALANRPLYAEKCPSFVKSVSLMVVRSTTGEPHVIPLLRPFTKITSAISFSLHYGRLSQISLLVLVR